MVCIDKKTTKSNIVNVDTGVEVKTSLPISESVSSGLLFRRIRKYNYAETRKKTNMENGRQKGSGK